MASLGGRLAARLAGAFGRGDGRLVERLDGLLEEIAIDGSLMDTANTRRDRIVELLKDEFTILEAFPTGFLVRGTALSGHADVDVIVALHYGKHIEGKEPEVGPLFTKALSELGIPVPSRDEASMTIAREFARQIIAGESSPYEGARRIW